MPEPKHIDRRTYWRRQVLRIAGLLAIWFVAGYVLSIFFAEALNQITLGGMPLGFWMAQQGSIYVFVLLILVFAISSSRLDRAAEVEETE